MIKYLLAFLLVMNILPFKVLAFSESAVIVKGNEVESVEGDYAIKSDSKSMSQTVLRLDSNSETSVHKAMYNADIDNSGEYDVWVLSTPGTSYDLSAWKWKIDDKELCVAPKSLSNNAARTGDGRVAVVRWTKLCTDSFQSGNHEIEFVTDVKPENPNNDFYYHQIDTIMFVPKSWGWTPYGKGLPYISGSISAQLENAMVTSQTVERSGSVEADITLKLNEKVSGDPVICAAVYRKDELVSKGYVQPEIPFSMRNAGEIYTDSVSVDIPFNAPDSEYELRFYIGIEEKELTKKQSVAFRIGEYKSYRINSISSDNAYARVSGNAIKINGDISFSLEEKELYVKFMKDDVLWGVARAVTNDSTEFTVPQGIPNDTYSAYLSAFGANGEISLGDIKINSSQTDLLYKPLSYGVYTSSKTGRETFWYIDSSNTMIRNGEPYIPKGGSVSLNYIAYYNEANEAANEIQWNRDIEELKTIRNEGVTDIYIIPVTFGQKRPAWAWQFAIDELERLGFNYGIQYGVGYRDAEFTCVRSGMKRFETTSKISSVGENEITYTLTKSSLQNLGTINTISKARFMVFDEENSYVCSADAAVTDTDAGWELTAVFNAPKIGEYRAVFVPTVNVSLRTICNYWDNRDDILSNIEAFTQKVECGDNLIHLCDLLANESGWYNSLEAVKPYSQNYSRAFALWLEEKYGSKEKLREKWCLSETVSFEKASELVPVFSDTQNDILYMTDNENKLYRSVLSKSFMWQDNLDFKEESFLEINNTASDTAKKNMNVPVILKNVWGYKDYFVNKNCSGGIDGLGAEAYGSYSSIAYHVSNTYAIADQFNKTAWLIALETSTDSNTQKMYDAGLFGYESEEYMHGHFDTLFYYGVKGFYDFILNARHSTIIDKVHSYISNFHQFDWLNNYCDVVDRKPIAENEYLWLEAEEQAYADMSVVSNTSASGEKLLRANLRKPSGEYSGVDFDYTVRKENVYDIWMLMQTPKYTSMSDVNVYNNDTLLASYPAEVNEYRAVYTEKVWEVDFELRWVKISSNLPLSAGDYTLKYRLSGIDFENWAGYYNGMIDCTVVVPSSWGWEPDASVEKPVDNSNSINDIRWLEAEYFPSTGFSKTTCDGTSGGYMMIANHRYNAELEYLTVDFKFNVNYEDKYDVYAIMFDRKSFSYMSPIYFSVDNGEKQDYSPSVSENNGLAPIELEANHEIWGTQGFKFSWVKAMSDLSLAAGNHSIQYSLSDIVALGSSNADYFNGMIDALVVVPSNMRWTPTADLENKPGLNKNMIDVYTYPAKYNYYTSPNGMSCVYADDGFDGLDEVTNQGDLRLMQTNDCKVKAEILVANFEDAPASFRAAEDFNSLISNIPEYEKVVYIGHRNDLGTVPELDKYFTDEFSEYDGKTVQILNPTPTSKILKTDDNGNPWAIRDGRLWIISDGDGITSKEVKYIEELGIAEFEFDVKLVSEGFFDKESQASPNTFSDGSYYYSAELENPQNKTVAFLAAEYDENNKVIKAQYKETNSVVFDFEIGEDTNKIKVFKWTDNMSPVTDCYIIERSKGL